MIKKILFVTLYALICISLVAFAVKGQKDIEDIKVLLADNLDIQKQILVELKKRGEK